MMTELRHAIETINGTHESLILARSIVREFGEKQGIVDLYFKSHQEDAFDIIDNIIEFDSYLHKIRQCQHATCTAFSIDESFSKLMSTMG